MTWSRNTIYSERGLAIFVCALSAALVLWAAATRPASVIDDARGATAQAPRCDASIDPSRAGVPMMCRTKSATLLIARESMPLQLGRTRVQVSDTQMGAVGLRVRLDVLEGGGFRAEQQTYLTVAGRRLRGAAGSTGSTDIRFALTPAQARWIRRQGGDLAIRGVGTPVVGVVRLSI